MAAGVKRRAREKEETTVGERERERENNECAKKERNEIKKKEKRGKRCRQADYYWHSESINQ